MDSAKIQRTAVYKVGKTVSPVETSIYTDSDKIIALFAKKTLAQIEKYLYLCTSFSEHWGEAI